MEILIAADCGIAYVTYVVFQVVSIEAIAARLSASKLLMGEQQLINQPVPTAFQHIDGISHTLAAQLEVAIQRVGDDTTQECHKDVPVVVELLEIAEQRAQYAACPSRLAGWLVVGGAHIVAYGKHDADKAAVDFVLNMTLGSAGQR